MDSGASEREIADTHFSSWLRYFRGIERYRRLAQKPRDFQTELLVYWGPPGTGKSKHAFELGGESQFWVVRPSAAGRAVWWDGYEGQKTVVIDEFYGWISRDLMQRLVDRYPMVTETKGGATQFLAERIIITSNKHPKDWWPKIGLGAMQRRLDEPIGYVFYVGNEQYPDAESFLSSEAYGKPGPDGEGIADVPKFDSPSVSGNLKRPRAAN